jgi:hypothetical protein
MSAAAKPLLEKAMDGLSTMGDMLTNGQKLGVTGDQKPNQVPSTAVWVRISRGFLADYVERNVDRRKPVRDYILGTTIAGESHTTGTTRFVLHSNEDQASGEVGFVGEVHAQTVGRNGPAILDYLADSTFRARKSITIGEAGLDTSPAEAIAPTRLKATDIHTNLPGLRDRITQRIAWRRVANTQSQADAIASDHTADDIRHGLDRRINESVASIQRMVQSQIANLKLNGEDQRMLIRSRSTPDFVELAVCQPGPRDNNWRMPSFSVEGNPDVAVRVHPLVLARVFRDPQLHGQITPMISQLFGGAKGLSDKDRERLNANLFALAGDWFAFDFTTPSQQEPPRTAVAEKLNGTRAR